MDFIKDFLKNASLKAKLITFGTFAALLIILIISIINFIITHQPAPVHVDIENFSNSLSEADLPDYYKTQIQQLVWSKIKDLPDIDQNNIIPATIREGSIKEQENGKYSLIVDIEPLHYSFRISFSWNPELSNQSYIEPGFYIECPYPDEIIYPETPCPVDTTISRAKRILPTDLTVDGVNVHAEIDNYNTKKPSIILDINSCEYNDTAKKGELVFRNWLKENLIDPNDINILTHIICYYL